MKTKVAIARVGKAAPTNCKPGQSKVALGGEPPRKIFSNSSNPVYSLSLLFLY